MSTTAVVNSASLGGKHTLSVDGGSIASLMASIEVIEDLMRRLQRELGLPELPRPYKHFRLMVGAGFSGLLVIMLGRLGMSIEEAKQHCLTIMNEVFSEKKRFGVETYKAAKLTTAIEHMLEVCGAGKDARMIHPIEDLPEGCKVIVCVSPEGGTAAGMAPVCLRTYSIVQNSLPDCTIVEAVRATFAAPGLFKPITVTEPGGIKSTYVGLASYDPVAKLLDEAENIFAHGRISSVLSIGAGQEGESATKCEQITKEVSAKLINQPGIYFRFSISQGTQHSGATDCAELLNGAKRAQSYLRIPEHGARMAVLTDRILEKKVKLAESNVAPAINHTLKQCPPPSPLFVGRETQLKFISRCLTDGQEERHICVLHGLGGVGKTQLALKFVDLWKGNYHSVFYIDCTSANTIDADLKSIALAKNVGDCSSDALTWLARLRENWLILYNNADDTSLNMRGYFPACEHGNILITTRNHGMIDLARGMEAGHYVSKMSNDDAQRLLVGVSRMSTEKVAGAGAALVEVLGCIPLAIVQAGAYIRTHMCSIEEYLDIFQSSRGQILEEYANEAQKADHYELTVYATWQASYRRLKPLAKQLYDLLAFMHSDQISSDIFRFATLGLQDKGALLPSDEETKVEQMASEVISNFTTLVDGAWDERIFLQTIDNLTSYSLLTYDHINQSYSIHPLVQQWARAKVFDSGTLCSCTAFLLASSVIWEYRTEDYAHRRVLINHIDALPDHERLKPRLAWRFRLVYSEAGRSKDEEMLLGAELKANMHQFGGNHPHTLTTMDNLATVYERQGQFADAEALRRDVLETRKRVWGDKHPDTLKSMGNMITTYESQGRWGDAEALECEAFEVKKRVWGREHPDTLASMSQLAVTHGARGRWDEAATLQREVLEIWRRLKGDEHPETLKCMAQLGATFGNQGRWEEAAVLQSDVFETGRRVWGDEHPETLKAMGQLGVTYGSQGRLDAAEALQRQVLEIGKRVWGNEHPDTLTSMTNLAKTYERLGQRDAAEGLEREVLDTRKRVWGSEHPSTLASMVSLSGLYGDRGWWKEAETLQLAAVDIGRRVWGSKHPDTLKIMGQLGVTYGRQGQWEAAEILHREVLGTGKQVWGKEHPDTLKVMSSLAKACENQGRWEDAEALQFEALEIGKRVWGNEHPDALMSMSQLANTYGSRGKLEEAEALQHEVLESRKRIWGIEHPDTLMAMGWLAVTYRLQARLGDAEALQRNVLETSRRVWSEEHPFIIESMGELATTYDAQGRWGEAESLLLQVLKIGKQTWGNQHPGTMANLERIAAMYTSRGRWDAAETLLRELIEIGKQVRGIEHPLTLAAMGNLSVTYTTRGRWEEAAELQREVLKLGKQVWGIEHPDTLNTMGHLGVTYGFLARWDEAEALQRELLEAGKRVWGKEHPSFLATMDHLAETYRGQGKWEASEALAHEVIEIKKRLWGPQHPITLGSMVRLAEKYEDRGRWEAAEELHREILETGERVWGIEHPDTLKTMGRLAATLERGGRQDAAEALEHKIFHTKSRLWGKEHPSTMESMCNLAAMHRNRGRWNVAETMECEVLEIRRRLWGDEHPSTLHSMHRLATTYSHLGRLQEAESLISDAVDTSKRILGGQHPDTIERSKTLDGIRHNRRAKSSINNWWFLLFSIFLAFVCWLVTLDSVTAFLHRHYRNVVS